MVVRAEARCDWPAFTFDAMPEQIFEAWRSLSLSPLLLAEPAADESAEQQPSMGCCCTTACVGGGGAVGAALAEVAVVASAAAEGVGVGATLVAPDGTGMAWGSVSFLQAASAIAHATKRRRGRRGRVMKTVVPAFFARR